MKKPEEKRRRSRVDAVRDRQAADQALDVIAIMEEVGEQATAVALWRMNGSEEQYIDRVAANELSLDYVRKHPQGGGGRYRIRVAGPRNAKGHAPWIRAHTFTIAGAPNQDASSGPVKAESRPWWAELAVAALPAVAGAIAAKMLEKKEADPLLLAILQQSSKGDAPTSVEIQSLVESARTAGFTQGKELGHAQALAENPPTSGEGDGPLTTAIKELGPSLVEVMKSGRTPTPVAPPRAQLASTTQAAPGTETTAAPGWVARVKPYLRYLLSWADAGKNAVVKAMTVLDDLPEADRESLAVSCESETFVQDVLGWLPELGTTDARRAWFSEFLTALQDALTTTEDEEDGGAQTEEAGESGAGAGDSTEPGAGTGGPAGTSGDGGGHAGGGDEPGGRAGRHRASGVGNPPGHGRGKPAKPGAARRRGR